MKAKMMDIGALLTARYGLGNTAVTAGGGGDNTEVNGAYIDVTGFDSIKVLIPFTTTLAASETLTFAANLQDATAIGGTGVADFGDAVAATIVATGPAGGGTVTGVVELDFDISQCRGFLRVQATPNLSRANTDTAAFSICYVLGGAMREPVSAALNA